MNVLDQASGRDWVLYNGDSCEVLPALPARSVHLALFSPPFSNLYTYTPSERDLGNVRNADEFFAHYAYLAQELKRVLVPGRTVVMHTAEVQHYETQHGIRNRYDFPGDCIRHMEAAGFAYRARVTIDKDAQIQAIRSHPVELLFATLRRDASKLGMAKADYLLVFTAPGDNPIPIQPDVSHEEWIQWARPVWHGIRETDVLPLAGSKDNDDERHLCPLQLPVIERCVRLWSNPGETVIDPFMGIGSTGTVALKAGRRAIGIELKPSYFKRAAHFMGEAERIGRAPTLFDALTEAPA